MSEIRKNAVLFKGNPLDLEGPQLKSGDRAPSSFTLVANDLKEVRGADIAGHPRILCSVPSLDTPVCDMETRRFNQEATRIGAVKVYAISMDLPFAQKRWCGGAGIERVQALSDWKHRDFAAQYGVWAPGLGLLARAVFVIDGQDKIRYVEYVRDVATEPDYKAAIEAARAMV